MSHDKAPVAWLVDEEERENVGQRHNPNDAVRRVDNDQAVHFCLDNSVDDGHQIVRFEARVQAFRRLRVLAPMQQSLFHRNVEIVVRPLSREIHYVELCIHIDDDAALVHDGHRRDPSLVEDVQDDNQRHVGRRRRNVSVRPNSQLKYRVPLERLRRSTHQLCVEHSEHSLVRENGDGRPRRRVDEWETVNLALDKHAHGLPQRRGGIDAHDAVGRGAHDAPRLNFVLLELVHRDEGRPVVLPQNVDKVRDRNHAHEPSQTAVPQRRRADAVLNEREERLLHKQRRVKHDYLAAVGKQVVARVPSKRLPKLPTRLHNIGRVDQVRNRLRRHTRVIEHGKCLRPHGRPRRPLAATAPWRRGKARLRVMLIVDIVHYAIAAVVPGCPHQRKTGGDGRLGRERRGEAGCGRRNTRCVRIRTRAALCIRTRRIGVDV
eukprot:Opistho-1_new@35624